MSVNVGTAVYCDVCGRPKHYEGAPPLNDYCICTAVAKELERLQADSAVGRDATLEERDRADPHHQRVNASGELVPVNAPRALQHGLPNADTPLMECPSNIGSASMRDRALRLKGMGPGELEMDKDGLLFMKLRHYLVYPDTVAVPDTGEIKSVVRSVLYDMEGKTFRTTSPYIAYRLSQMAQLLTPEEWMDGVHVIISTHPSKRYRGGSYHDMAMDLSKLS